MFGNSFNMFKGLGLQAMLVSQLLSFLFPASIAVDQNCNYYQKMDAGVTYYVYNREYPDNYSGAQNCRWIADAPEGSTIEISCQLQIPQSSSCSMDRLLISLTGNPNLENAHTYCGTGDLTLESQKNNVSIALTAPANTSGGRFLCTLRAKNVQPTCDCGWKSQRRIVGGVETGINEFPMMAALIDYVVRGLYCGATIIARRYALTAAHCLKNKQPSTTGLLVGEHNISTNSETSATRLHNTIEFMVHPQYNPNDIKGKNDIAVVKTDTYIDFNMDVGPACLPFTHYYETFAGQSVEALGWGTTEFTGPKSSVLMKTDLNVLDYQTCASTVEGTVDQMCTYKAGHDACQSDSGGPLLWMDQDSMRINVLGVISTGVGCASNKPALNTRVTSYINWITSVTKDAVYCVK